MDRAVQSVGKPIDPQDQLRLLQALLRTDLTSFVRKVFSTVAPGAVYKHNWHIEAITEQLRRCHQGECKRLLITQPPRSLKSICTSVAYVAWALGHNPKLKFICVSYSQDLSEELARQFRMVVKSDWYRALFPGMRLQSETASKCVTTRGGSRVATSIGGTLTGRGADFIIVDDPMKAEDAQSDAVRKQVSDWYRGSLVTRLDDQSRGVILVVMQRLHEDDLTGEVIATGTFEHLNLPSIAIEDQAVSLGRGRTHHRAVGDVLHPYHLSAEDLARLKSDLGSLRFSAQYQQQPVPFEGNLVKRSWFGTYEALPGRGQAIQSWDIATATTDTADYSACVTAKVYRNEVYIMDVWRGRLSFPDLKRKIGALAKHYSANTVLVERAGPGLQMLQELRANPIYGVPTPISITPKGDKAQRLEGVTSRIEAGDVRLPEDAAWKAVFLNELLAFPSGRHDDQVDAFSQLLTRSRERSGGASIDVSAAAIPIVL
ncbi:MAG: phage terminase large subunit [Pseudomonadota bacterium]